MKVLCTFVLVMLASVACEGAAPTQCIPPPAKFGDEVPLLGCDISDGKTVCVYPFKTMFPKLQFWSCVILMVQNKCKLPFEALKVVCDPIDTADPAPKAPR